MGKILVSENFIRLDEVKRLIRYIESRESNYGEKHPNILNHLRARRDKLKK